MDDDSGNIEHSVDPEELHELIERFKEYPEGQEFLDAWCEGLTEAMEDPNSVAAQKLRDALPNLKNAACERGMV